MRSRSILRGAYLEVFGSIKRPKKGLHVLSAHFTGIDRISSPEEYLEYIRFLKSLGTVISFQDALSYFDNKSRINKIDDCLITLTYDDGFKECHDVIMPVLNQEKISACFFISPNYVDANSDYIDKYNSIVKASKRPMSWDDIVELSARGHVIGSHTLDHEDISKLDDLRCQDQLARSKEIIEMHTKRPCQCLAVPFGRRDNVNRHSLNIAKKYYKYVFGCFDYTKYWSYDGDIINRRLVESFWPNAHIRYFLSFEKTVNNS